MTLYVRRPFPSKEIRQISERHDPGPPVVPGGQGIGLGERVGDGGGPETVCALLCVAERRATRPNGEWGYSTRRHMLGPVRPEAVSPARRATRPNGEWGYSTRDSNLN